MPKLSFMKWYPADWINDTRELSPEAKAAWIDMLCLMWNAPERGIWKGSYQEFARATGLPWEIAPRVVRELSLKTSRVTFRDNEVTLENRRMVNQETDYKSHANRQKQYRVRRTSDKKVTDKTLDSQYSSRLLKTTSNTNTVAAKAAEFDFDSVWKRYPKRLGRKEAEKHFRASVKSAVDFQAINSALSNYLRYIRDKKTDEQFVKMGSTWFNNWQDWKDYSGGSHGTNGGEGFSEYAAIAKRARQSMGLREPPAAGSLLAGIRAMPEIPDEAQAIDGSRERIHADLVEEVRAGSFKNEPLGSPEDPAVGKLRDSQLQRTDAD